jgi:hypothetical protein
MPLLLEFGSRSGSWLALAFFSLILSVLGWAVAQAARRRWRGEYVTLGRVLGLAVFLGPLLLVYASMLSGFYDAEVDADTIRLRYLVPGSVTEIPAALATARIAPAYRDRVRLVLSAADRHYESTPWHRDRVTESLARLNALLPARR